MLKRICLFLCLITITNYVSLAAYETTPFSSIQCAPELQKYLDKIQKLPEGRELISSIQKDGPIKIRGTQAQLAKQFGAYWDATNRVINIDLNGQMSEGRILGTLLFELHNASVNSKWDCIDQLAYYKLIDRNTYTKASEFVEYQNSLNTARLADRGIEMGLFPKDARMPIYSSFEEHYFYQQKGGHAEAVAKNYDNLMRVSQYRSFYN